MDAKTPLASWPVLLVTQGHPWKSQEEKLESRWQRDRSKASKNVKQLQLGYQERARKSMTNTCKSGEKDSD
jgi:hypothetical protein